jgi:hypothetical protein
MFQPVLKNFKYWLKKKERLVIFLFVLLGRRVVAVQPCFAGPADDGGNSSGSQARPDILGPI